MPKLENLKLSQWFLNFLKSILSQNGNVHHFISRLCRFAVPGQSSSPGFALPHIHQFVLCSFRHSAFAGKRKPICFLLLSFGCLFGWFCVSFLMSYFFGGVEGDKSDRNVAEPSQINGHCYRTPLAVSLSESP